MSTDIVESLPERKHAPVAAAPSKGKPEAKKGGGSSEESSEKKRSPDNGKKSSIRF